MNKRIKIIATKELDGKLIELAATYNINLVVKPVIRIINLDNGVEVAEALKNADYDAIVFTSKNAVKAFSEVQLKYKFKVPSKLVYAVGHETAKFLKMLGFKAIYPARQNARALARLIRQNKDLKSVLFICGLKHRKELPEILNKHHIKVKPVAVYDTLNLNPKVNLRGVQGVLFFSPSAVKSYFFSNSDHPGITYFSIGNSTTETLQRFTHNRVITAREPSKTELLREAYKYFLTNTEIELI